MLETLRPRCAAPADPDVTLARRHPERLAAVPAEPHERVHAAGMEPVRSEIDRVSPEPDRDGAAPDPVACFQHRDGEALGHAKPRGRDPGRPGADDRDVDVVRRSGERWDGDRGKGSEHRRACP